MATAIHKTIAQYTNSIQDGMTRRAVQRVANELYEGSIGDYLKVNGTAVTSSAAELNKLDGVSSTATEIDYRALTAKLEDVSAAQSIYVVSPYTGNISTIYAVLAATTLAPTPDVFSFGVNGVSLSGNTITVSTGTTVATASSVTATASAKAITAGQVIRISGNGGSTGPTMDAIFTILIDIT